MILKKELKGIEDNIKIVKDLIKKDKLYYNLNKIDIDNYLNKLKDRRDTLVLLIYYK
jgi:hypothetical protein